MTVMLLTETLLDTGVSTGIQRRSAATIRVYGPGVADLLRLLPGHFPKRTGFSNFFKGSRYLMEVLAAAGKPIVVKTPAKEFP
ncbi:MAG TPA: hypothetical protein VK463_05420 [Desulfomonilaceae bacterium]|nr:hypothetical protein [Desulfomonilaceae bacterium]